MEPAAASSIDAGETVNASSLGSAGSVDFNGGTLKVDTSATFSPNFAVEAVNGNTIDADGHTGTFSGVFSGAGSLAINDSVGGGTVIFSSDLNTYTGTTTINSGATFSLSGSGSISDSTGVIDNGTFNIASTTAGASVISLSGAGSVVLSAEPLTVTSGSGTFSGGISGTGGLVIAGATEVLSGANTYTGGTTISAGTLQIGGGAASGSIIGNVADAGTLSFDRTDSTTFDGTISGTGGVTLADGGSVMLTATNTYTGVTLINSGTLALSSSGSVAGSSVTDDGTFDISATAGATIKSLAGPGTVQLGTATLTLSTASGTFTGVIAGDGNLVLNGGTETLTGANTYTGTTTVNGGTLQLGSAVVVNNITDNATVGFDGSAGVAMSGVMSGSGNVTQLAGVTTISVAQTYTGTTTISGGTLALAGAGSIATSSGVTDNGAFSISGAAAGVSIASLSGSGLVDLGPTNLTLTNASGNFSGVISGPGGLTLLSGNETLSGVNTFTGITTISGGTLVVSNIASLMTSSVVDDATLDVSTVTSDGNATTVPVASLTGTGAVVLGATTITVTGAVGTFSGTISGTGGFTLSGGTQTLSGANSYTGTTTISGGSLVLAGNGSLASSDIVADSGVFDISGVTAGPTVTLASLSGTGTVVLGSETLNLANASTTFTGAISGAGGLQVSGGTQVLAGANSYTGGTTITAGTLQIGNAISTGTIVGNVADDGILAFGNATTATFSGAISGTGSVAQTGSGTTILTASETYTGGTVIAAGTLQIGNGTASGSIAGDVSDNGTLAFGRSDTATFAGTISGTGGLTQISGRTILTAIESYTGPTTIDSLAGLTISGPGSIASSSLVVDNGTLDLSGTSAAPQLMGLAGTGSVLIGGQTLALTDGTSDFSGGISGTGGLAIGGGIQTLSGTNSYTGSTTINGGTLEVNGSIASSSGVTINSGGTLAGSGTVPSVVLASGAAIAPGASGSGTLNVNGTVTFVPGSKFVVELNSASAGKLSTTGAEALAGTLSIASTDGTYLLGQKLTVLTAAGGVSGTFTLSPVASSGAQFSSALSYDAHDVYLEIDLAKLSPLLPVGSTVNESNAVGGIDAAIAAANTLPTAFENLGTVSPATLQADAAQFAGQVGSDLSQASQSMFNPFIDTIFNHIADEQPNGTLHSRLPQRDEVWAGGLVGTTIVNGEPATVGSQRLQSSMTGMMIGGDWSLTPAMLLGVAVSAGSSNFRLANDFGQGKVSALQFSVYGLVQYSRHFYGSFAGALSLDNATTTRVLTVSGTDTLVGKSSPRVLGGRYETGIELGWITPYVALQDALFDAPSYREVASGGSSTYALSYAGHTTNSADFEMGFRQRIDVDLDDWTLKLSDRFGWQHDMSATASADPNFTALPNSTFTAYGVRPGKDGLLFSLGAGLDSKEGFGVNVHFDSTTTAKSQTYNEFAGLSYAW
ncbi:MAG TPA: autotransporter-associated beta strand repeat-containing protein [Rhizomicrobium sp.]|nr:autotransporter-associated beta strand repeat-containing protein [Rhizomicrobium sp.]